MLQARIWDSLAGTYTTLTCVTAAISPAAVTSCTLYPPAAAATPAAVACVRAISAPAATPIAVLTPFTEAVVG